MIASRCRIVFVVLVAVVMAALCVPALAAAADVGTITGHVYYGPGGEERDWGDPIDGITVSLFKHTLVGGVMKWVPAGTAVTDGTGFYEFVSLEASSAGTAYTVGILAGAKDAVGSDYGVWFYQSGESSTSVATPVELVEGAVEFADSIDLYPTYVGPSIRGTVRGSDFVPRLPIAGLDMSCYEYSDADGFWMEMDWSQTDPLGNYGFWGLPTGTYRVGYQSPRPDIYGVRWKSEFWTPAATTTGVGATSVEAATDIAFTSGTGSHLSGKDLVLDKARKVISGIVTRRGTTIRLPGIDVNLYDPDNMGEGQYAGTTTDAQGTYAFWDDELPATPVTSIVEFRAWGFDTEFYNHAASAATATPIAVSSAMAPMLTVNGAVAPVAPSIQGTVTNGEGDGIADVAVGIYVQGQDPSADFPQYFTFTDGAGHYEYFIPWGFADEDFRVRFYTGDMPEPAFDVFEPGQAPAEYTSEYYDNELFFLNADVLTLGPTSAVTADATLTAGTIPSVTGEVRAASGAPVAGVRIEALSYDPDALEFFVEQWSAPTEADGGYALYGLGNGQYAVGMPAGWQDNGRFYQQSWWLNAATLDEAGEVVTSGGDTHADVDIIATELPPLLSGRVTSTKTGVGVADAYIQLWYDMGGDMWDLAPDGVVQSKADGTWAYYAAIADPAYRIEFGADGFIGEYWNNVTDFDLATAVPVTVGSQVASLNAGLIPQPYTAMRYDGSDFGASNRYTVAASIASLHTEGYDYNPHIIIACGEDAAMADPLAAGGLSWAYGNAPMLLTPKGPSTPNYSTPAVPRYVLDALVAATRNVRATHRADGITVHIVGGTASVPDARVLEMREYVRRRLGLSSTEVAKAFKVDRIAGATRYDNAYLIARVMKSRRGAEMPGIAFVVNGSDPTKFWDAMAASPISAGRGVPLILVQTTAVPAAAAKTKTYLGLTGSKLYVVGPTTSVSAAVASGLGATNRIKGPTSDPFATARAVSDWGINRGYSDKVTCAITAALPDALGAGPYLGVRQGSMLFVPKGVTTIPSSTSGFLSARKATLRDVFIFGGKASVTSAQQTAINNALKP